MNIPDLLDDLEINWIDDGHEHCRPGWVQVDCPSCALVGHWRLGINLAHKYASCWACGAMHLPSVLAELSGHPYGALKARLAGIFREDRGRAAPRGRLTLPHGLGPLLPAHKQYLRGRGLDPQRMYDLWGLQGIGPVGPLKWRVFVPVTLNGKVVSWTTRSIGAGGVRYLSATPEQEAHPHKEVLYGEEHAGHAVAVCEGPFDVFNVGPGAVCTFGLGYSRPQVLRIVEHPVRAVVFDSSPDAQRRARQLCDELEAYPGKTMLIELDAEDPGSASPREVAMLRRAVFGGA